MCLTYRIREVELALQQTSTFRNGESLLPFVLKLQCWCQLYINAMSITCNY